MPRASLFLRHVMFAAVLGVLLELALVWPSWTNALPVICYISHFNEKG